jgi:hypothetical protein
MKETDSADICSPAVEKLSSSPVVKKLNVGGVLRYSAKTLVWMSGIKDVGRDRPYVHLS